MTVEWHIVNGTFKSFGKKDKNTFDIITKTLKHMSQKVSEHVHSKQVKWYVRRNAI